MIALEPRARVVLSKALTALPDQRFVLVPSNVCFAVPRACTAAGCEVEYVDIDPVTLEIDVQHCIDRLKGNAGHYTALVFVRPYGAMLQRRAAFAELRRAAPGLLLVDDRCLCPPEAPDEVDSMGADLILFSTGAKKYIDLGCGGYGVLGPGIRYDEPTPTTPGPRSEIDRYFALVAEKRPSVVEQKRRINAIYRKGIPSVACLSDTYQDWRFNILVNEAGTLVQKLFEEGLFASRHYSDLTVTSPLKSHTNAGLIAAHIVNLFNDDYFSEEQAKRTAVIVRKHVGSAGVPTWAKAITGRA